MSSVAASVSSGESAHELKGREAVHRASPLTVGMIIFLASECMFFAAMFGAYFTLRSLSAGPWPPEGAELEVTRASIFTALLVSSSFTMQYAVGKLIKGNVKAFRTWVIITVFLGVIFVGNQLIAEWPNVGFLPSDHAYGSLFFTMTGFHALHVSAGLLAMGFMLGRSGSKRFGAKDIPAVEVVSYYWHFVDVVWVLMFSILFFLK